jgi:hypothetical protein
MIKKSISFCNCICTFPKNLIMAKKDEFIQAIKDGYTFKGESVKI